MTRKDYVEVARVISESIEDWQLKNLAGIIQAAEDLTASEAASIALIDLADRLAEEVFAPDNPLFDRNRFIDACLALDHNTINGLDNLPDGIPAFTVGGFIEAATS